MTTVQIPRKSQNPTARVDNSKGAYSDLGFGACLDIRALVIGHWSFHPGCRPPLAQFENLLPVVTANPVVWPPLGVIETNSEAGLLGRCRSGEAAAWNELFDRYYGPAARFVFQLSPDLAREDMEEICQETFLAVVKNLASFQGNAQFQTWLFRIATNKTRDFLDRRATAKRGGGQTTISLQAEDPHTGLTPDPVSPAPGPDADLLRQERWQQLTSALGKLGEPCREIIELRYFADLSYDEIGAALELNTKTVSSRLSKCLDRLEAVVRETAAGEQSRDLPSN